LPQESAKEFKSHIFQPHQVFCVPASIGKAAPTPKRVTDFIK